MHDDHKRNRYKNAIFSRIERGNILLVTNSMKILQSDKSLCFLAFLEKTLPGQPRIESTSEVCVAGR